MERFSPTAERGLTQEQVDDRIFRGLKNTAPESPSKSKKEIIYSNLFTYFNLIFFLIAILLIFVGAFRDMTFLPIIVANTCIGIFQELHAKKVLDELTILNAPKCKVVRDGKTEELPAEDLVLDDMVLFSAGNQIPADAVIEEGEVLVNESLITGESDQVAKKKGDPLLSGSFIVSGECRARLDQIGADSYVSQLSRQAKVMNEAESSEMIRSLNKLVKIVGILIIPIGIILFSQQYFINESGAKDSVTGTVAAIIGMIPEGLYLLANVALAASVARLAMKKVLVHDMKCIETLARVDVLCVDKTGTITDNTMSVKKMLPLRPGKDTAQETAFTAEELS
ncbi:MAG: HAD-IC family P-type ATPase, partial [Lachnospiraceae bacterium]|nr:HAD-IC family P-type ATPase [Lachnospiraceae bacterium]